MHIRLLQGLHVQLSGCCRRPAGGTCYCQHVRLDPGGCCREAMHEGAKAATRSARHHQRVQSEPQLKLYDTSAASSRSKRGLLHDRADATSMSAGTAAARQSTLQRHMTCQHQLTQGQASGRDGVETATSWANQQLALAGDVGPPLMVSPRLPGKLAG
jgi:hypothetical protein